MQKNKVNGISFQQFELDTGIPNRQMYRYKQSSHNEKEMLEKAFIYKFGPGNKATRILVYYMAELLSVEKHSQRNLMVKRIHNDFMKNAEHFNFSKVDAKWIWFKAIKSIYPNNQEYLSI